MEYLPAAGAAQQLFFERAAQAGVERQPVGRIRQYLGMRIECLLLHPFGAKPELARLITLETLPVATGQIAQGELVVPIRQHRDGGTGGEGGATAERQGTVIEHLATVRIPQQECELTVVATPVSLLHLECANGQPLSQQRQAVSIDTEGAAQRVANHHEESVVDDGTLIPERPQHKHPGGQLARWIINGHRQREGGGDAPPPLETILRGQTIVLDLVLGHIAARHLGIDRAFLADASREIAILGIPGRQQGGKGRPQWQHLGKIVDQPLLAVDLGRAVVLAKCPRGTALLGHRQRRKQHPAEQGNTRPQQGVMILHGVCPS